jgi:ribonuclease HI
MDKAEIEAWFAGACWPKNPGGCASYGAVISKDKEIVWKHAGIVIPIDRTTNNLAEYAAYLAVIEELLRCGWTEQRTTVMGDSRMVINQMSRIWEIKRKAYFPLARKALALTTEFTKLELKWIERGQNTRADSLAHEVLFSDGAICTPCVANDDPHRTCKCLCHRRFNPSTVKDLDASASLQRSLQELVY